MGREKTARDNPKHGSLLRAFGRIGNDYSRKIITEADRTALFKLARERQQTLIFQEAYHTVMDEAMRNI